MHIASIARSYRLFRIRTRPPIFWKKTEVSAANHPQHTVHQCASVGKVCFRHSVRWREGGSARRFRVSRNGAPRTGSKREKMGGEESVAGNGTTFPAAHLFPLPLSTPCTIPQPTPGGCGISIFPLSPSLGTVHHSASERSERAEPPPKLRWSCHGHFVRCRGQRVRDTPLPVRSGISYRDLCLARASSNGTPHSPQANISVISVLSV